MLQKRLIDLSLGNAFQR